MIGVIPYFQTLFRKSWLFPLNANVAKTEGFLNKANVYFSDHVQMGMSTTREIFISSIK